jgi:serine/threonine protein kinase
MQDDAFRAAPRLGPAPNGLAAKRQRDMNEFPRRFGPYVLLKPLARGGMGALYLALSGPEDSAKLCVIKTVLPHLADKEYLQRFRDEAKVVVRLSHGNLVPVFDSGQVAGEIYLAMDFVEGKDLRATWNRCAKKGIAFPVDVAAHIVKELARGLNYAHGFGDIKLVHRDVSPPNVLLSYSGEVRLTDFGLASSTLKLEKTAPGIIYGKVSYMSPEQARGEKLDGRTDLYASGIILWELLTGRQLFPSSKPPGAPKDGPHVEEILRRVRNPELVPPSKRAVAGAARAGPHHVEGAGARSQGSLLPLRGAAPRSGDVPGADVARDGHGAAGELPPRPVLGGHRGGAARARGAHRQDARVVFDEALHLVLGRPRAGADARPVVTKPIAGPPPCRQERRRRHPRSRRGRRTSRIRGGPGNRPGRSPRAAAVSGARGQASVSRSQQGEPSVDHHAAQRAARADRFAGRRPFDGRAGDRRRRAATTCASCAAKAGWAASTRRSTSTSASASR